VLLRAVRYFHSFGKSRRWVRQGYEEQYGQYITVMRDLVQRSKIYYQQLYSYNAHNNAWHV
jgi:hypothetical protein